MLTTIAVPVIYSEGIISSKKIMMTKMEKTYWISNILHVADGAPMDIINTVVL